MSENISKNAAVTILENFVNYPAAYCIISRFPCEKLKLNSYKKKIKLKNLIFFFFFQGSF